MLRIGKDIINIFDALLQSNDIHDIIKGYVENIQESCLGELNEIPEELILISWKLEKWGIMFLFFFSLERKAMKKMNAVLNY